MNLQERISAFDNIATELARIVEEKPETSARKHLLELSERMQHSNGWFTKKMIMHRLKTLSGAMRSEKVKQWTGCYSITEHSPKTIAVILAGNIPLSGIDDLLSILIHGDRFLGKLSSDDQKLFPAFCELIMEIEPRFKEQISFVEGKLSGMDAVIATGSNNSGKYFDFYFSKYPHIIRRNRNGVAVLTGKESDDELKKLADDIFIYFGAGCRSVSKLFVPTGFDFDRLFRSLTAWGEELMMNNRYMNNYEYNRTVYLLNDQKLLDNNFLLLKQDIGISSPPGVLYYEFYGSENELQTKLRTDRTLMQCIIGHAAGGEKTVGFGEAQLTELWDYADGIDTIEFLQKLAR